MSTLTAQPCPWECRWPKHCLFLTILLQLRTLSQLKDFQDNFPMSLVTQSTSAYPVRGGKRELPLTTAMTWSWPQSKLSLPRPGFSWDPAAGSQSPPACRALPAVCATQAVLPRVLFSVYTPYNLLSFRVYFVAFPLLGQWKRGACLCLAVLRNLLQLFSPLQPLGLECSFLCLISSVCQWGESLSCNQ